MEKNVSREMSRLESGVLNYIRNRGSLANPAPARKIREDLGLSKRLLELVIESLRVNFKQPIVAKKTFPYGYYLPRNEEERQAGLAPYRKQIETEQRNLAIVMGIDLEEYWGNKV